MLIVDGQPLVLRGLRALIEGESDLTVCAAADTQREALGAITSFAPDLVITELSHEDGDDLALLRAIRRDHGSLPVLILSRHDAPDYLARAVRAGANGFVTKHETNRTLLFAIRCVLEGKSYVSPALEAGPRRR